MNVFRYALDQRVTVVDGHHVGQSGVIKAMEVRRKEAGGEITVVTVKTRERTFCTPEHNVRPA